MKVIVYPLRPVSVAEPPWAWRIETRGGVIKAVSPRAEFESRPAATRDAVANNPDMEVVLLEVPPDDLA